MNSAQAKNISLYSLLQHIGQSPADVRKSRDDVWYCSPFRNEKTASFKIKLSDNVWYDFGEGAGGNIIDFVMKYNNCDFKAALAYLDATGLADKSGNIKNEVKSPRLHLHLSDTGGKLKGGFDFTFNPDKCTSIESTIAAVMIQKKELSTNTMIKGIGWNELIIGMVKNTAIKNE